MTDAERQEFLDWCKKKFRMWSPDKATINLYEEWQASKALTK